MYVTRRLGQIATHGIGFRQLDGFVDCSTQTYRERWGLNSALHSSLEELRSWASGGGGEKGRRRQASQGKWDVRRRLDALLDPGAPRLELGLLVGHGMDYGHIPAAGSVNLIGEVSGRLVMVTGNDGTVKGGTIFPCALKKQLRCQEIAAALRLPTVYITDSGGAYLPLQSEIFLPGGRSFFNEAAMGASGLPQVGVVAGNCTAGGAYVPTMCDEVVMVDRIGSMFLGGPPLVKAATGEVVSAEDLGGARMHTGQSGGADYFAVDERAAYASVRDMVSCFNSDVGLRRPLDEGRPPVHSAVELDGLAGDPTPGSQFLYQVLARITDASEFFEFRGRYGDALVCGFARISGRLVGVIAETGNELGIKSAEKASQWVQICDQRDIPLVFLQRSIKPPTTEPSALRAFSAFIAATSCATVPKIAVNLGGCVGHDMVLMLGPGMQPTLSLSWPTGKLGEATSPCDAVPAAANMCTDIVIRPTETRETLSNILRIVPDKREQGSKRNPMIRM